MTIDLMIVGGGPAGLAAGLQAAHMGLCVKILEKGHLGGRLRLARRVENVPGLNLTVNGLELVERLKDQVQSKGLIPEFGQCFLIDYANDSFVVHKSQKIFTCGAVIVATGVTPKKPEIRGLDSNDPRLIYSWLDTPRKHGLKIAVIGGGESAFDQACSLAERGVKVLVLVRGPKAKAFGGLVTEAEKLGVRVAYESTIDRIETRGSELTIHLTGKCNSPIKVDYILPAIGTNPSELEISETATLKRDRGLYWAGDVCCGNFRQVSIAFGDGIKKAMIAYEYLKRS